MLIEDQLIKHDIQQLGTTEGPISASEPSTSNDFKTKLATELYDVSSIGILSTLSSLRKSSEATFTTMELTEQATTVQYTTNQVKDDQIPTTMEATTTSQTTESTISPTVVIKPIQASTLDISGTVAPLQPTLAASKSRKTTITKQNTVDSKEEEDDLVKVIGK